MSIAAVKIHGDSICFLGKKDIEKSLGIESGLERELIILKIN